MTWQLKPAMNTRVEIAFFFKKNADQLFFDSWMTGRLVCRSGGALVGWGAGRLRLLLRR